MGPFDYIVEEIRGEYAYLKRLDADEKEPLMIALFLLPQGIDIGTKLRYENLEYTVFV